MISPKFYSQVLVCQTCRGWGYRNSPPEKNGEPCPECGGKGVFLQQADDVYYWSAPTHIAYRARDRVLLLKLLVFVFATALFLFILIFIRNLFINFPGFSY